MGRPRRPVALTLTLIAHARDAGGGAECPVDICPQLPLYPGSSVVATCPPPLLHPECGLQVTVAICIKGARPASSLESCAADRFGFLPWGTIPGHLFRTLVTQAVVWGLSRFLLLRLACVDYLPHPECGFQDTCVGICTGLEGSRPTSSLTGGGKDGHRTNHERRETEQPGRFGARGSAGLAGVN